jgi:hypothetical protein
LEAERNTDKPTGTKIPPAHHFILAAREGDRAFVHTTECDSSDLALVAEQGVAAGRACW